MAANMASGVPYCASGWGLLMVLWLSALPASAAQDELNIPASCGSQAELEREIAALRVEAQPGAGEQKGDAEPSAAIVEQRPVVRLRADGPDFLLEVELPGGVRRLRDTDCRSLFRAAVVIAALGDEAQRAQAEPTTSPPGPVAAPVGAAALLSKPAPQTDNPEQPGKPAAAQPNSSSPDTGPVEVRAGAREHRVERELAPFVAGALAYGLVPELGAALSAGVSARRDWLAGRMYLSYLTPRSQYQDGAGVRVDGFSASATLELPATSWLRPGLGGDYHLLRGRGLGVTRTRSDWAALGTLHAGLTLRIVRIGRAQLDGLLRGLYAPRASHFRVRGLGDVYSTSPFGFQAGLALAWHFR